MAQYTITLTTEEEKALLWDMISIQEWADNAVHNKARQCADEICRIALEDQTHTILTRAEKRQLRDYLDNQGVVLTSVKQLPINAKRQIVAVARVKSAAERQAEFDARMPQRG